ncbi:MAG: peptidoglycan recognition family protein, partial [Bryobacteraceae bacterium]
PARQSVPTPTAEVPAAADVWLVEKTAESETYSNGLRIDNHFLVDTHSRSFLAFPADGGRPVRRAEPAGIVFHTTESTQAPFEASENRVLKRIGESLLEYVRRQQAYNFVLDRFGRVYRVVPEDEAANHSGNSAWADENWFYINLNESFLGISFEAASPSAEQNTGISPAQVRSAAMLIEMLRHRYRIPASNYVTHAQVSVNPSNMQVGLHLDWASGFPFEAIGLGDNYAAPLPALWAYGFDYDSNFARRAATRMHAGIEDAERILIRRAAAAGLQPTEYKTRLRQRYRGMLAQARLAQVRLTP